MANSPIDPIIEDKVKRTDSLDRRLDRLEARLGWTEADVKEFQGIWSTMRNSGRDGITSLGVSLLLWILENLPDAKERFEFVGYNKADLDIIQRIPSDEENDEEMNDKFIKHALAIVLELDRVIHCLPDMHEAMARMVAIAQSHIPRHVTHRHFYEFKNKFHLLLYATMRVEKNSRTCQLWNQFNDLMATVVKEEADAAKEQNKTNCCSSCSIL